MPNPIPESELILNKDGSVYHLNLKPGQVATDIIGVGDPDRVGEISKYFDQIDLKVQKREFVTHTGWYQGKRISVISTGMGTDNVEIFMTELDALFNVDLENRLPKQSHQTLNIFRVGTSGSMQAGIPSGSLLMSSYGLGLDTLMYFYNLAYSRQERQISEKAKELLQLPFSPYCVQGSSVLMDKFKNEMSSGITVTCPGFFGPQGRQVRIAPALPEIFTQLGMCRDLDFLFTNFEMETAGYYAMGKLLGHEVISLNAIVANRIDKSFDPLPDRTIGKLIALVLKNI